jgi:hypothetical protein
MRGSFALGALGWQVALADIANVRICKIRTAFSVEEEHLPFPAERLRTWS